MSVSVSGIIAVYVVASAFVLVTGAQIETSSEKCVHDPPLDRVARVVAFGTLWPLILPVAVAYGAVLLWRKWL